MNPRDRKQAREPYTITSSKEASGVDNPDAGNNACTNSQPEEGCSTKSNASNIDISAS